MSGTLSVPNSFGSASGNVPASQLDNNYGAIVVYINAREVTVGLVGVRPAFGVAGRYYLATDVSGGTLYVDTGTAWVQAGRSVTTSGRLVAATTATGTGANTAETMLQTANVAAGQLALAGDSVIARALFTTAANANLKTARIRAGVTTLTGSLLIGGDAIALNGGSILLEVEIIRRTGVTQIAWGRRWGNDAAVYPSVAGSSGLGLTLANAFLIEATGQNGTASANDIVCQSLTVDFVTP